MFGSLGRSVATSEGAEHRGAASPGVDAIKFCVKKLVRCAITENPSWKIVDDVAENQDVFRIVIVDALFVFLLKQTTTAKRILLLHLTVWE